MGLLTMSFHGICMHLNRRIVGLVAGHPVHRVVAVNAENGAQTKYGPLPPHFCWLETTEAVREKLVAAGLPLDAGNRIRLQGVALRVANPAHPDQPVRAHVDHLPKLTEFSPDMILLPDLRLARVPDNAACFVEITHGEVLEHTHPEGGGMYSTWTVETAGDPTLLVGIGGREVAVTLPSSGESPLPDGHDRMVLRNSTTKAEDKQFDFLLHYLAAVGGIDAQTFPNGFPMSSTHLHPPRHEQVDVATTTSCSNSQYP